MKFKKGDTYKGKDDDHRTYGITNITTEHINQIEVYGDRGLRDTIIKLLNEEDKRCKPEKS